MNTNHTHHKISIRILLICLCGLLCVSSTAVADGIFADAKKAIPMAFTARVMEVNVAEAYIIIGETKVLVTPFRLDGKSGQTELMGANGNVVGLDAFKKDQRVSFEGFRLAPPSQTIVGIKIVQAPSSGRFDSKKRPPIRKMQPIR